MKIKITKFKVKKQIIGLYDKKTIYIGKNLKLIDKITTFLHELGHYLIDVLVHKNKKNYNYVYDTICVLFDNKYKRKDKFFKWYTDYYLY